ncbi:hypothetical protein ACGO3R_07715 [Lactococcus lactis]
MTFTISKESLPFRADKSISQITLSNERLTIVVHDYGARVHQLLTPDKNGTFENILLSKNNSETYANDGGYYGVICGPVAGRISGATYDSVSLEANEGKIIYIQEAMAGKDNFGLMKLLKQHHLLALN